jgi:hypothetical protein
LSALGNQVNLGGTAGILLLSQLWGRIFCMLEEWVWVFLDGETTQMRKSI